MIKVIPLKYYDGGFMTQAFAFGGTRDKEKCEDVKYGSSLQNFLIDDGNEVILSDTGMPNETPDFPKKDDAPLWMGEKVATFKEAFLKTGYKFEDVTKDQIQEKLKAFTDTMNNTLESATKYGKGSTSVKNAASTIKNLNTQYASDLAKIGITVNKDGSMSLYENASKNYSVSKFSEFFDKDSQYLTDLYSAAKRITRRVDVRI